MITRKAAAGFILLAVLVFPVAYFTWTPPLPQANVDDLISDFNQNHHEDNSVTKTMAYRPPLVQFDTAFDMGVAVTMIIEVFTLVCYLVLKRIEPAVNAWVESERERIAEIGDE
jgi:hypothetical protein